MTCSLKAQVEVRSLLPCACDLILEGRSHFAGVIELRQGHMGLGAPTQLAKAVAFPVVVYACESWTIKKAER